MPPQSQLQDKHAHITNHVIELRITYHSQIAQSQNTNQGKELMGDFLSSGRGIRIIWGNCAHCDRNLKFGTMIEYSLTKILKYRAIADLSRKQNGCHFVLETNLRWPYILKSLLSYSIIVPHVKFLSNCARFFRIPLPLISLCATSVHSALFFFFFFFI